MNIFPFKRRLRRQAVADLLYEDVFYPLADNISVFLHDRLIDTEGTNTKFKLECFSLIAFLVTFSFQREFEYLGQDTNKFILDCFHGKLFENVSKTFEYETFSNLLKTRYGEYYPVMKEDLRCIGDCTNNIAN